MVILCVAEHSLRSSLFRSFQASGSRARARGQR